MFFSGFQAIFKRFMKKSTVMTLQKGYKTLFLFHNFFIIFFLYVKRTRQASAKYYQKDKEKIQKKSSERYQNLSEKEKKVRIWL